MKRHAIGFAVALSLSGAVAFAEADVFRSLVSGEVRELGNRVYHLRAATNLSFYVSNHDHAESRGVFIPMLGVTNALLRGSGAKFVFHGSGIGLLMMDTSNVRLEGVSFDWARPMFSDGDVLETKGGRVRVRFDDKTFPMRLDESGKLVAVGEDWEEPQRLMHSFAADGSQLDLTWTSGKAEPGEGGSWWIDYAVPQGTSFIMTRNGHRPCPGIVLYRADDTVMQDVAVHAAFCIVRTTQ